MHFIVTLIFVVFCGLAISVAPASADTFCKAKNGNVTIRASCKRRETVVTLSNYGAVGPQGTTGATGVQGLAGADGSLRIYGDGSAGALDIPAGATRTLYTDVAIDGNLQFTDCTIGTAATFIVSSGAIIRCSGNFTNSGSVTVIAVSSVSGAGYYISTGTAYIFGPPGIGISGAQAYSGEFGDNSETRSGGIRARGIDLAEARSILRPGMLGGSGGAGSLLSIGGNGGGTIVVLARGDVLINASGAITAPGGVGGFGSGGGGGGVIVIASTGTITNNGIVKAEGGNGGASSSSSSAGGGGGGGLVHMLAPVITAGTVSINNGTAGSSGSAGSVTETLRVGGGGGGSGAGSGGDGGNVFANGNPNAAADGIGGWSIQTLVDPTSLF